MHGVVIVGLVCFLVVAQFAEPFFNRGIEQPGSVARIPRNPMGVNTFLDLEPDPEVVEQSMDMIAEGGFGYIRQSFGWFDIEPEAKGVYEDRFGNSSWAKFDRIVDLAEEHDIEIIARLEKPPRWARAEQGNLEQFPDGPPDRIEDWIDYIQAVATRYEGRINYYQIWNEPNLEGEWGGQPIDPEGYLDLLRPAYETIKEIDPEATVLLAGLAPTDQRGPANLSELLFLEQLYEAGGAEYFDVVTAMVYGYGFSPWDRRVAFERNNFSRVIQMREIMVEHGDDDKPIWAAEYGWVALPEDWAGNPSPWGEPVSFEKQADYLVQGYLRAQREWPWMEVMVVWAFRFPRPPDHPDELANPTRGFALVEHDFSPRPAYIALQDAAPRIQRVGSGRYALTPAMREDLSLGRPVTLHIAGERLDLRVEGNAGGAIEVEIDGLSTQQYDIESADRQTITVARDLPNGPHDIRLAVLARPNGEPPEILSYRVRWTPVSAWIYPWIDAALILALLLNIGSLGWQVVERRRLATTDATDDVRATCSEVEEPQAVDSVHRC